MQNVSKFSIFFPSYNYNDLVIDIYISQLLHSIVSVFSRHQ